MIYVLDRSPLQMIDAVFLMWTSKQIRAISMFWLVADLQKFQKITRIWRLCKEQENTATDRDWEPATNEPAAWDPRVLSSKSKTKELCARFTSTKYCHPLPGALRNVLFWLQACDWSQTRHECCSCTVVYYPNIALHHVTCQGTSFIHISSTFKIEWKKVPNNAFLSPILCTQQNRKIFLMPCETTNWCLQNTLFHLHVKRMWKCHEKYWRHFPQWKSKISFFRSFFKATASWIDEKI